MKHIRKNYSIEDLNNGRAALFNDGTEEELTEVLSHAFPNCKKEINNKEKYFFADKANATVWDSSNHEQNLPIENTTNLIVWVKIRERNRKKYGKMIGESDKKVLNRENIQVKINTSKDAQRAYNILKNAKEEIEDGAISQIEWLSRTQAKIIKRFFSLNLYYSDYNWTFSVKFGHKQHEVSLDEFEAVIKNELEKTEYADLNLISHNFLIKRNFVKNGYSRFYELRTNKNIFCEFHDGGQFSVEQQDSVGNTLRRFKSGSYCLIQSDFDLIFKLLGIVESQELQEPVIDIDYLVTLGFSLTSEDFYGDYYLINNEFISCKFTAIGGFGLYVKEEYRELKLFETIIHNITKSDFLLLLKLLEIEDLFKNHPYSINLIDEGQHQLYKSLNGKGNILLALKDLGLEDFPNISVALNGRCDESYKISYILSCFSSFNIKCDLLHRPKENGKPDEYDLYEINVLIGHDNDLRTIYFIAFLLKNIYGNEEVDIYISYSTMPIDERKLICIGSYLMKCPNKINISRPIRLDEILEMNINNTESLKLNELFPNINPHSSGECCYLLDLENKSRFDKFKWVYYRPNNYIHTYSDNHINGSDQDDEYDETIHDSSYEKYGDYNGWSDQDIDEAFDGNPEATWNVD